MKTFVIYAKSRLARLAFFAFTLCVLVSSVAHAGLTLEMNVVHYSYAGNYYYYFSPNLGTNNTPPNITFGDYFVASPGFPTNGATALYHFDATGFNQTSGGSGGFNNFDAPDFNDSMLKSLTNGQWSIFVTNATTTNVYHFSVTASITSNSLPPVIVTFPAYGSVGVTNQPTFTWQGPTNYDDLVGYEYHNSPYLPVTQTSWFSPSVLPDGLNDFTPHYDHYSTTDVISSVPLDSGSQPIASWVSTAHLQDYFDSQFTVGAVDPAGTAHTLIAHYPFDATSGAVLDAANDTSDNGYNLSFGGSFGSAGGAQMTSDSAVGVGAVQFQDGDNQSGGYLGWTTTPPNVLTALSGSFTVSCWIKTTQNIAYDNAPAYQGAGIVAADNGGLANDVVPLALTGSKIGFNTGGNSDDTLNSSAGVNDGNYHHIVVTRNQPTGQKIIYIDGVLDSFSSGTTNVLSDPQKLTIGAMADASDPNANDFNEYNGFAGEVDDLQIYAGAISSNDVAYLYNNPGHVVPDGGGGAFSTALNTTNLIWSTGGDLGWFTETQTTYDGKEAAQSGAITDDGSTWIQTTVPADGQLSFFWKVSSESDFDYLHFFINGEEQDAISGEQDWNQESYAVSAGDTVRWEYDKDDSNSDGADAGFLDEVNYVPTPINTNTPPVITVNPFSQTNYPGYNVSLFAAASGNPPPTWQWFKVGSGAIAGATNALYIPVNSGSSGVAGSYYALANNFVDTANTSTATVTFANAPLPPDWSRVLKTPYANSVSNYNIAGTLDSAGNIFTVGSVTGAGSFAGNTLIATNGNSGATILKQTAAGVAIWGLSMTNNGDPSASSFAECVVPAPGNGVYVSGDFFGTNWLGTNQLNGPIAGSTFLTRIDANGNILWVRAFVGTNGNFTEYHQLISDPAGNVTVSALISGGTAIGTTNIFTDGQLGVLVQFDANGTVRWTLVPSGWASYLAYSDGRIYGTMGGSAINYIGGVTNLSDRRQALFALNATNGQGLWVHGIAAQHDQGNPAGLIDDAAMVAVSGTNVFVSGSAWGSNAVFSPFAVNFPTAKGQYLARYDTNGNAQMAVTFGSQTTWPWAIVANAAGAVYVGGDFDTYSIFGPDIIAAPFNATIQFAGTIDNRIPGQSFIAKFDLNGNPQWARTAQSQISYLNTRDIMLAADGVWACGFFNQLAVLGTNTIFSAAPDGYLGKVTDGVASAQAVSLTAQIVGTNYQVSFISQTGFTNTVQYRTNLVQGAWQNYSSVTGDGTLKNVLIPISVFNGSPQGFIRLYTQ